MLYVVREDTEPYFNIAAEEYFLKHFDEDIFMLWQNDPCVVVGKHQNTLAEINVDFLERNGIPVIRRISGGGTVYHDPGNLNYTFIANGNKENLVNFRKYTAPIILAIEKLGLTVKFEGKNNITLNGLKISGNAEHVFRNRILHHGTLLFSSQIHDLENAILVEPGKFADNAVKSIRSQVTNIGDHLEFDINMVKFKEHIRESVLEELKNVREYRLNNKDYSEIRKLVNEKYKTWDWNFGYSPQYDFVKTLRSDKGTVNIYLKVQNGIIKKTRVTGDLIRPEKINYFEDLFTAVPHIPVKLKKILNKINIKLYFKNITEKEILKCMY